VAFFAFHLIIYRNSLVLQQVSARINQQMSCLMSVLYIFWDRRDRDRMVVGIIMNVHPPGLIPLAYIVMIVHPPVLIPLTHSHDCSPSWLDTSNTQVNNHDYVC
jgi:hypothetical protein